MFYIKLFLSQLFDLMKIFFMFPMFLYVLLLQLFSFACKQVISIRSTHYFFRVFAHAEGVQVFLPVFVGPLSQLKWCFMSQFLSKVMIFTIRMSMWVWVVILLLESHYRFLWWVLRVHSSIHIFLHHLLYLLHHKHIPMFIQDRLAPSQRIQCHQSYRTCHRHRMLLRYMFFLSTFLILSVQTYTFQL